MVLNFSPIDEKLRKQISEDEDPPMAWNLQLKRYFENLVSSVSDNRGFAGVMDSFTHVTYDNFNDLFIYSMLKYKNKK